MKYLLFSIIILSFIKVANGQIAINKIEAQKIYSTLNKIRANKNVYLKPYQLDAKLKVNKKALILDSNLQKAAEAKALDMAQRQYFGHVNPDGIAMNYYINNAGYTLPEKYYTPKDLNYFESIGAGADSGIAMLKMLIIDATVPSKAHRDHLLGVGAFNSTLVNIGIGFVTCNIDNCYYKTYCCILIARH